MMKDKIRGDVMAWDKTKAAGTCGLWSDFGHVLTVAFCKIYAGRWHFCDSCQALSSTLLAAGNPFLKMPWPMKRNCSGDHKKDVDKIAALKLISSVPEKHTCFPRLESLTQFIHPCCSVIHFVQRNAILKWFLMVFFYFK